LARIFFSHISDDPRYQRHPRSIEKFFSANRNMAIPYAQLKTDLGANDTPLD